MKLMDPFSLDCCVPVHQHLARENRERMPKEWRSGRELFCLGQQRSTLPTNVRHTVSVPWYHSHYSILQSHEITQQLYFSQGLNRDSYSTLWVVCRNVPDLWTVVLFYFAWQRWVWLCVSSKLTEQILDNYTGCFFLFVLLVPILRGALETVLNRDQSTL